MELKVLRTNATEEEMLEKLEGDYIQLFIVSKEHCNSELPHDLGDILINSDNDHRFALLVKENENDKIKVHNLRVAVIRLLQQAVDVMHKKLGVIVINKHQFRNENEVNAFVATLQEFLLITSYGDELTEDSTLIITNYGQSLKGSILSLFDKKEDEEA